MSKTPLQQTVETIRPHFTLLGLKVRDRVTNFTGIATSLSFDLYGCVQVAVDAGFDKGGDMRRAHWFDINRLEVVNKRPVMERPVVLMPLIEEAPKRAQPHQGGPAEKPLPR